MERLQPVPGDELRDVGARAALGTGDGALLSALGRLLRVGVAHESSGK
jgi:hypothetical protein